MDENNREDEEQVSAADAASETPAPEAAAAPEGAEAASAAEASAPEDGGADAASDEASAHDDSGLDLELVKRVLETALLVSPEAMTLPELKKLFDQDLGNETLAQGAGGSARRLGRQGRRADQRRFGLAFPRASRIPEIPRPAQPAEAAEVLARRARNARHHRVQAAGDARRHRGHPWRHRVEQHTQVAGSARLDRRRRAIARCRDVRRCTRRPGLSSTT